jgi:dTDP-4-dehydrorhamnose 3,5-epimerase
MYAPDVTVEWLQEQELILQPVNQATIGGVLFRPLQLHLDGRGGVMELWSEPWEGFLRPTHVYQSSTDYHVVKGWHLHEVHTDQMAITRGKVQVVAADLRLDSPTRGHVNSFILGIERPGLLRIPPRLLHGWKALSGPEIIVVNLQDHIYSSDDEFKFPWDCVLSDVWEPKNG